MLITAVILTPFALHKMRTAEKPQTREYLFPILAGVFSSLDHGLWATAIEQTTVANATLLNNISPLWVALFAILVWRERLGLRFWVGLAALLAGASAVLGSTILIRPDFVSGDFYAHRFQSLLCRVLPDDPTGKKAHRHAALPVDHDGNSDCVPAGFYPGDGAAVGRLFPDNVPGLSGRGAGLAVGRLFPDDLHVGKAAGFRGDTDNGGAAGADGAAGDPAGGRGAAGGADIGRGGGAGGDLSGEYCPGEGSRQYRRKKLATDTCAAPAVLYSCKYPIPLWFISFS